MLRISMGAPVLGTPRIPPRCAFYQMCPARVRSTVSKPILSPTYALFADFSRLRDGRVGSVGRVYRVLRYRQPGCDED